MSKDDRGPPLPSGPPAFRPAGEYGPVRTPPVTRLEALQAQPVGEEALTRAAKALYKAYEETTDEHVEQVWNYASHPDADVRAIWSETVVEMMQWAQKTIDAAALTASPPVVEREAIDRALILAVEDMIDAPFSLYPIEPMEVGEYRDRLYRIWSPLRDAILALTPVAQGDEVRDALSTAFEIVDMAPELNMSNYDHDDVVELNNAMIEVHQFLLATLTKGARDAG